jgi:hypothetical protein
MRALVARQTRAEMINGFSFDLEFDMWHWRDWVLVRLLLREADGLISQPPLPASSATVR